MAILNRSVSYSVDLLLSSFSEGAVSLGLKSISF